MELRRLWLVDFRSYATAEVEFAPGLTAVVGQNGRGKTNLLEGLGYLATLKSFRGAPNEALVRQGQDRAVVRAEGRREERSLLIEAEIVARGRGRIQVNKQRVPRARDLLGALRVSVFTPDDLVLVKGGPAQRRDYLDDALVSVHVRNDALQGDLDRILRQRNALLKQCGGRLDADAAFTLDVFDAKLTEAGEALTEARVALVDQLVPALQAAYEEVAQRPDPVSVAYVAPWRDRGLAASLVDSRKDDVRRGISLVGPHRDDLELTVNGLPSRTHASQGEQRSLTLALRLAAHGVVTEAVGEAPILVLDDVFSELDPARSAALIRALPAGQAILTTAGSVPDAVVPDQIVHVDEGPDGTSRIDGRG